MRNDDTDDEALELEIGKFLAVESSPEFMALVRQRIASEQIHSRPGLAWIPLPIGAAVAIAMLIVLSRALAPSDHGEAHIVPEAVSPLASLGPPNTGPANTPAPSVSLAVAVARTRHVAGNAVESSREVLISSTDAEGLQLLVAAVRAGRLDGAVFEDTQPIADEPPLQFATITVAPIVIDPLPQVALEGMNP